MIALPTRIERPSVSSRVRRRRRTSRRRARAQKTRSLRRLRPSQRGFSSDERRARRSRASSPGVRRFPRSHLNSSDMISRANLRNEIISEKRPIKFTHPPGSKFDHILFQLTDEPMNGRGIALPERFSIHLRVIGKGPWWSHATSLEPARSTHACSGPRSRWRSGRDAGSPRTRSSRARPRARRSRRARRPRPTARSSSRAARGPRRRDRIIIIIVSASSTARAAPRSSAARPRSLPPPPPHPPA